MKRIFLLAVTLILAAAVASAQRKQIDSLKLFISKAPDDSTKVKALFTLAQQYEFFSADSAILTIQRAYTLAVTTKTVSYQRRSLILLVNSICTGRSFAQMTDNHRLIEDALSAFVQNTAPKLREQGSLCGQVQVFLQTSQFEVVHKIKNAAWHMDLAIPTNITQELLRYAVECLKRIYRSGYPYQKVGIFLTRFTPEYARQMYLLEDMNKREKMLKLSRLTDRMNNIFGKDVVRFAAMGYEGKWKMRQQYLSQRYTTRIADVLVINPVRFFPTI